MTEDFYNDHYAVLGPVVEAVAAQMARRYFRFGASNEDFSQESWVWICQHPERVTEFLENADYGMKMLARTLQNELHDAGEDLKAQHLGYSRDDLVWYNKAQVRELLPLMFDEEAWLHPETPNEDTERRSPSAPAEGGNWIATLADISRAFDTLDSEDRDLLGAFHRDGWANKMLAATYGVSEQTMSYRHDMAVKRLLNALGGPRPRPEHDAECDHPYRPWGGRRFVTTNASARAIQENAWDEGA